MPRVKRVGWVLGVGLVGLSVIVGEAHAQSSTTNPYRASFGWEKLPDGRAMGTVSGVFPDPPVDEASRSASAGGSGGWRRCEPATAFTGIIG